MDLSTRGGVRQVCHPPHSSLLGRVILVSLLKLFVDTDWDKLFVTGSQTTIRMLSHLFVVAVAELVGLGSD